MPSGRNKKPLALQKGNLTIEEKEARAEAEEKFLKGNTNQLKPPKWLDSEAKREFNRIVKELKALEVVQNLDLTVLAVYCNAYSNYVKLTEAIDRNGAIETYINKAGAENNVVSASVQAQHKYIDVIFKCSTRLGLSVSDRLKLIVPKEDENDELIKALNS